MDSLPRIILTDRLPLFLAGWKALGRKSQAPVSLSPEVRDLFSSQRPDKRSSSDRCLLVSLSSPPPKTDGVVCPPIPRPPILPEVPLFGGEELGETRVGPKEPGLYLEPQLAIVDSDYEEPAFSSGCGVVKCLLPNVDEPEAGEVLGRHLDFVRDISLRIGSWPVACLTGIKGTQPLQDSNQLGGRGLKFFFSPEPEMFLDRAQDILITYCFLLMAKDNNDLDAKRLHMKKFIDLQHCNPKVGASFRLVGTGHPILAQLLPYDHATQLVNLTDIERGEFSFI